jgi:hypothetical protein
MKLEDIELISRKVERSEQVIAKFVDGYAAGWEFAVKEVFKESLDIKKTIKTINKKAFQIETQGVAYNFNEGDIFYNSKLGYTNWLQFLKGKNPISLQILSCGSCSCGYETKNVKTTITSPLKIQDNSKVKTINSLKITEQVLNKGGIRVLVLRPNQQRNRLVEDTEPLEMSITSFVTLLQNGIFYDNRTEQYLSFRYEG